MSATVQVPVKPEDFNSKQIVSNVHMYEWHNNNYTHALYSVQRKASAAQGW